MKHVLGGQVTATQSELLQFTAGLEGLEKTTQMFPHTLVPGQVEVLQMWKRLHDTG